MMLQLLYYIAIFQTSQMKAAQLNLSARIVKWSKAACTKQLI